MVSLQLADYGAEVVKVEARTRGDTLRDWKEKGLSVHWKVYARNKKSITLDLKSPEAPRVIRDLLPKFDVLIESFRFGYMEKLGLGPEALHAVNPNRSEEHTSELQSLMRISYAVFCLKNKKNQTIQ